MKRFASLTTLLCICCAVVLYFAGAQASDDLITEVGASQIGDNTAKAIHYDLERFDRTIAFFEDVDNGILPLADDNEQAARIRRILAKHTYWAVRYVPKDHKDHNGMTVFIDSHTGAILGIYTDK